MNFSLSQWFKGKRTDAGPASTPPEPAAAASSPAATVIKQAPPPPPRTTATTARIPARPATHTAVPNPLRAPSARPAIVPAGPVGPVRSTTRVGRVPASLPPRLRKSPFAGSIAMLHATPGKAREPGVAEPLPAGPDLPVVLELGDFLDKIPAGLLQTGTLDRNRRVEFRSSELYSDLARGRASVAASVIYQKCPEVFSHAVGQGEDTEVALPLSKLVEQMAPALKTRPDQAPAESTGEIDTPFRQAAIEDNERLPRAAGTTAGPIPAPLSVAPAAAPVTKLAPNPVEMHFPRPAPRQISAIPTVKVIGEFPSPLAPPTAQSAGSISALKRPPSTVRASVAGGKIRLSGPAAVNRGYSAGRAGEEGETGRIAAVDPAQPSPSLQVSKKTARIHLPPISLRVTNAPRSVPAPAQPIPAPPAIPAFRPPPTIDRGGSATFRSTPPAPRPSRQSSSPFGSSRPTFPPPAFPSAPPPAQPPASADAEVKPASPALPPPDGREIRLRLAPVLRGIPPTLLSAEASSVPEDIEFALPFRLVEPQLSSGRVAIPRHVFIRALPESHRDILGAGDEPTEIPLPLEEVFRRLPSNALALRADQTVQETGEAFPTPFKQKADEDAERFGAPTPEPPATPVSAEAIAAEAPLAVESGLGLDEAARETVLIPPLEEIIRDRAPAPAPEEPAAAEVKVKPPEENAEPPVALAEPAPAIEEEVSLPPLALTPEPVETPAPVALIAEPEAPAPEPVQTPEPAPEPIRISLSEFAPHVESDAALQAILMSDEDMDAKTVVRLVSKLPGISGCTVMFGDGFRLAGNFPEEAQAEGFCAMSPVFYKRAATFAEEVHFGDLQTLTLYTADGLLSFFMDADICLSVKHSGRGFLPGVREKLQGVTREMAIKYAAAHPAPIPH